MKTLLFFWILPGQVINDPLDDNVYLIFEGLPGGQLMAWNEKTGTYTAQPASERPLVVAKRCTVWVLGPPHKPSSKLVLGIPGKETCSLQIESFSCSQSVSHTEALPLRSRLGSAVNDSRPLHAGYSGPIEMDIWVFCERLAKHFARQLADGIAYIHSLGAPDGRTKIAHTHTLTFIRIYARSIVHQCNNNMKVAVQVVPVHHAKFMMGSTGSDLSRLASVRLCLWA